LLHAIEPANGANQNITDAADHKVFTRTDAAREAGMSDRQVSQLNRGAEGPLVSIDTDGDFGANLHRG
jgi:hypothetical protein